MEDEESVDGEKEKARNGRWRRDCPRERTPSGMFDCRLARKSSVANTSEGGGDRVRDERKSAAKVATDSIPDSWRLRGCRKHDFIDLPH